MEIISIRAARSNFSELLVRVEAGEEILLARGKVPVAKLVPLQLPKKKRRFGALKGKIHVGPDFFEPLPKRELKHWR